MKVTPKYKFKMKELRDSPPNITVGENNWETLEELLTAAETQDIDCGTFEEKINPILNHNSSKRAHTNLILDANDSRNNINETLEDHEIDPDAHGNIKIDANTF